MYFVVIDFTIKVKCEVLLLFALSVTRIVVVYVWESVPTGNLGTSWVPSLNLMVLLASSYVKKSGKSVTVVDWTPLPPALSLDVTFIGEKALSNAVISQFVLSAGVWIVGFVTSFTFNGMVTSLVVPSLNVTVAVIFWSP